ncbi:MAG: carboxypeptidase-like regulatory domain-containing protein [Candidatus Marinimicrobia bacterium]|nr:carboxypeptidase-like regulatory domain-containing protein [Candidatus Neomarinimicrobiota bacterium]
MNKRVLCYFRILLLVLLPQLVFGGNVGKIFGKITDSETGEPLIGANITITETYQGATTDVHGDFVIVNIHPGSYTVNVSYIGYESVSMLGVYVTVDNTTYLDNQLSKETIEGSVVTVVAKRHLIDKSHTASKHSVGSESMEKQPVRDMKDVLETQAGIFQNTYRGDSRVNSVILMNGISTNSGLFSDNFSGFNLSAIQEISVMTGGYNAEYGEARAAVINITEKKTAQGIHGSVISRVRPAGKYHFGRNMYSKDNYDITHFDLDYWTTQSENPISKFYQEDPAELLEQWQEQSTPDPTLGDYAERDQWFYESTLYGGLFEGVTFLISGRRENSVGIFPQSIPYNSEQNIQGYLNFDLFKRLQLRIGGFAGEKETALTGGGLRYSKGANYIISSNNSNFDSWEGSEEHRHLGATIVAGPYDQNKYNPMGVIYDHFPELRNWNQLYLTLTYTVNPNSFLKLNISQLSDAMDRSDRYGAVPDSLWSRRDDTFLMVTQFRDQGYYHSFDKSESVIRQFRFDYTNQYTKDQQVKLGTGYKTFDIDLEHFMASYEGGGRWNLLNVMSGRPYEGHFYLQNLTELPGIILNGGVRLDYFNQNRNASNNMFDPLAIETTTPGHDPWQPMGIPGDPETTPTELQVKVAPRLGLSHPISETALLHFSYGHFYQRPSWSKMLGLPFVNYTEDMETVLDPYAEQETYMEEWQGFYGNPNLGYEKSVQYELGLDLVYNNLIKVDFTGYYKDAEQIASVTTGLFGSEYFATKAYMMSNGGYSDTRGMETSLETRFNTSVNGGITYDIFWSFSGKVGYSRLNEPGSEFPDLRYDDSFSKQIWSGSQKVKGWISYDLAQGKGPSFFGIHPFSDLHAYAYFWWRSGTPYTYHPPGDLSTKPNNMTWFDIYQFNLKLSKGITIGGIHTVFSLDAQNILNSKFLSLLYNDQLRYYHENSNLPLEERLPTNLFSGEPNVWEWYTYEVSPRQIEFQIRIDY